MAFLAVVAVMILLLPAVAWARLVRDRRHAQRALCELAALLVVTAVLAGFSIGAIILPVALLAAASAAASFWVDGSERSTPS